ncbi:hypothetical protein AT1219_90141 [Vibrio alginolyticus]
MVALKLVIVMPLNGKFSELAIITIHRLIQVLTEGHASKSGTKRASIFNKRFDLLRKHNHKPN